MFEPKVYKVTSREVENLIFNFTRYAFRWQNFPIESVEILCKLTRTIPMNAHYREYDLDSDVLVFWVQPFSEVIKDSEIVQLQEPSIKLLMK